ncbi:MAG: hypothetical protein ACJ8J7_12440 [Sulfurifustaceae bacterium]
MAISEGTDAAHGDAMAAQMLRAVRWVRQGWNGARRDLPFWLGMAALYLAGAALLARLPFAGPLLVLMLSPMLLAGALLAAEAETRAVSGPETAYQRWVHQPGAALFAALTDADRVYSTVLLGIIVLGLIVTTFIIEYLFGFGSLHTLFSRSLYRATSIWAILPGIAGAAILQILLAMALVYAVHRTVLAGRDPFAGIAESFTACARHPVALATFGVIFLVPYIAVMIAFRFSTALGYVLLLAIGSIALPVSVIATLASYREIFPASLSNRPR